MPPLLAAVRAGQPEALAALYREHASAMLTLAYRLAASRDDAEDVVHDVFVGLPEALARYEERGQLRAWLLRLTTRVALMRGRRERGRVVVAADHAAPALAERDSAAEARVHRALLSLSPSLRHVFVLRALYDHTHAEIASLLGISVSASEVRMHRAVHQLRRLLEDLA
jgi:RNA polymerase sigma-70 factor (ECF subfamily)